MAVVSLFESRQRGAWSHQVDVRNILQLTQLGTSARVQNLTLQSTCQARETLKKRKGPLLIESEQAGLSR